MESWLRYEFFKMTFNLLGRKGNLHNYIPEKEVGRKKAVLRVFQACRSVFGDSDERS